MHDRRFLCLVFVLAAQASLAAQDAPAGTAGSAPAGAPSLAEVVARLQEREKAAKSFELKVKSRSAVPDGPQFETEGTLRVLGTTHFHLAMKMRLGDGMEGENEVVKTPEGTWTREANPIQPEVFTVMTKDLMREVEAAAKVLGDEAGALPGQGEAPLGSAMLTSLAKRFDLKVADKLVRDGFDHWVIRGDARPSEASPAADLPEPDRVEMLVRALSDGPLAVVKMVQFDQAAEVMSIEFTDLVLDRPMAEASFKLDSRGKKVLDVLDHPPAAAQIQGMLAEARKKTQEQKDKADKAGGETGKEAGK
jgi:hypothetical protein